MYSLGSKLSVIGLDTSRSCAGYLGNGFYFDMYQGDDKYTAVFNFKRKSIIIRKNDVDVKEWI